MPNGLRCFFLLSLVILTAAISGCVTLDQPLIPPASATVDGNIIGKWSEDGTRNTTEFDPSGTAGMMAEIDTKPDDKGQITTSRTLYDFFVVSINGHTYTCASLRGKANGTYLNEWYFMNRYTVSGNVMLLEAVDNDAVERAINNGTLQGTIQKDNTVSLLASPDKVILNRDSLVRYLESNSGDDLFGSPTVYHRIGSPSTFLSTPVQIPTPSPPAAAPPSPATAPVTAPVTAPTSENPPPTSAAPAALPTPSVPAPAPAPQSPDNSDVMPTLPDSSSFDAFVLVPWAALMIMAAAFIAVKVSGKVNSFDPLLLVAIFCFLGSFALPSFSTSPSGSDGPIFRGWQCSETVIRCAWSSIAELFTKGHTSPVGFLVFLGSVVALVAFLVNAVYSIFREESKAWAVVLFVSLAPVLYWVTLKPLFGYYVWLASYAVLAWFVRKSNWG